MSEANKLSEREKWVIEPGWHYVEEERVLVFNSGNSISMNQGIVRDSDGFTLTWEGGNLVEGFEIFRGRSGSDVFEFFADHVRTATRSSNYTIIVNTSEAPRKIIYKYAKDIEAALKVLPFNSMKAENVKFDISESLQASNLVCAEDIQL